MSESFYNYLVGSVLKPFFERNKALSSNKYYIILENKEQRYALLRAFQDCPRSKRLRLEQISSNRLLAGFAEPYDAMLLEFAGCAPIILADSDSANEDYLNTLRNAVCEEGNSLHGHGLLLILSNNRMESLTTACANLQSRELPFSPLKITETIRQQIGETFEGNDYEKKYIEFYLDRVSEGIAEGISILSDYADVMNVLAQKSLKDQFSDLGFFSDKKIYNQAFEEERIEERIEDNAEKYNRVQNALSEDVDEAKKRLCKFLDEDLAEKIATGTEEWQKLDYETIRKSEEKKSASEKLLFDKIDFRSDEDGALYNIQYCKQRKGTDVKTTQNIIVCDPANHERLIGRIAFNKAIKGESISPQTLKSDGRFLYVPIENEAVRITVGANNNKHTFNIIRIATSEDTFDHISGIFSVTAKGNIEIDVPDDDDKVIIGHGDHAISEDAAALSWDDNNKLTIHVDDSESTKQEVKIAFKNRAITFVLKLNQERITPWSATRIFETIWKDKVSFHRVQNSIIEDKIEFRRIRSENDDCSVQRTFGQWLLHEWEIVTSKSPALKWFDNGEYEHLELDLPKQITVALNAVLEYFETNQTVPSLAYIDDTLKSLYRTYIESVKEEIEAQDSNKTLPILVQNIKRLGVLELPDGRIAMTPFHPLMIAFMLEFAARFDSDDFQPDTLKLITPFYLIPFIDYLQEKYRPYVDSETENLKTWQLYEEVTSKPQQHSYKIATKMVASKLDQFLKHFNYLFPDKECPIKISVIGLRDDEAIIKGLIEFLCKHAQGESVQRVEIHEYVDDLLNESYYERLNRLGSSEQILKELTGRLNITFKKSDEYTENDIIRLLFMRVAFYKHALNACNNQIQYSHITFYQIDTGNKFVVVPTDELRFELSMYGLISMPSTANRNGEYMIGFGSLGMEMNQESILFPMVRSLNALYADEGGMYKKNACLAKRYQFSESALLTSIYENSNWVTFLNPEVDVDFFYKQDVYIVHYTDQETINAGYDSITVTKHVDQYNQMLGRSYSSAGFCDDADIKAFVKRMKDYFNCLNGDWLLSIVNKSEVQINEKLSIVATCIGMLQFMSRVDGVVWIPISLDEILRVTGNVGLPKESVFSKASLKIKGVMSDDLLMIGLDAHHAGGLKLYFYPIEVKLSDSTSLIQKGIEQVNATCRTLREKLCGEDGFTRNIYRILFVTQFLSNADKFYANQLIDLPTYEIIQASRFQLLNLHYEIVERLPNRHIGNCALVSYCGTTSRSLTLVHLDSDVNICKIVMPKDDCFKCVTDIPDELGAFLNKHSVIVPDSAARDQPASEPVSVSNGVQSNQCNTDGIKAETPTQNIVPIMPFQLSDSLSPDSRDEAVEVIPSKPKLDRKGIRILIGTRKNDHSSNIYFEPTNTNKITHPNMGIIGTMGTGKTQFAKSIIAQLSRDWVNNVGQTPIGVLVFDYKGDYNDPSFIDTVRGNCYKIKFPFNPLKLLRTAETEGLNLPSITADRIADSLQKAFNLGNVQRNNIKQIIVGVYSDFGITKDPSTWDNPAPTMRNVIDRYLDKYDTNDSVFAIFSTLNDYSLFAENNNECVSLFEWLDGVKIIDLTLYEDNTKKLIGSLILDIFYAEMKQMRESETDAGFRQLRAMILVDEAHQFLKARFNALRKIISEGRMFGVGMILSTQNIGDFKTSDEDFTQYIMSWVLHHVPNVTKSDLERIFGSNNSQLPSYINYINKAGKFESLIKLGNNVSAVDDLPYYRLLEIDSRFKEETEECIC